MNNRPAQPELAKQDSWQSTMQQAVVSVDELLAILQLDRRQLPELDDSSPFPLRVPHPFISRMRVGDPADPLLLQVLPLGKENVVANGFINDPLAEAAATRGDGVVSKYHGRTLLVTTGACPVHCRYCFRRHFPYQEQALRGGIDATIEKLTALDHEEIILSGGDTLSLGNKRLSRLLDGLQRLPALERLRIHTRFPVIVPQRIDEELLALLANVPQPLVIVLHVNHAQELDDHVKTAVRAFRDINITVLNQSVLLAGINATVEAQIDLAGALWQTGVMPYYLHQLDPVAGAAHFEVCDQDALKIIAAMRRRLPGYLVPKLVREKAGATSKTPLTM
ncbi:MAG: EF-P beta-lysylation protein EpmB [Gammaproteobacteria bacterium]|nr:EF-P beta-lysylation protein EpmB [Gammaproteobacteria bacterium]